MNAKMSVFVISVKVIIYLLKYNLYECIINNMLYMNKKLFHFGIIYQPKFSIFELYDEILHHLSFENIYTQHLQNHLQLYILGKIALLALFPQSAIVGFADVLDQNCLLVNHLLLIFKYNMYNSWVNNNLSFKGLTCAISQIKYTEQTISEIDLNRKRKNSHNS